MTSLFSIFRLWYCLSTLALLFNLSNQQPGSWTVLGLNIFFNYFLPNDIITKIDAYKIEHQPNIVIFVWDYDNLIGSKQKQIIKPVQNQRDV